LRYYIKNFLDQEDSLSLWTDIGTDGAAYWPFLRHYILRKIITVNEGHIPIKKNKFPRAQIILKESLSLIRTAIALRKRKFFEIGFIISAVNARNQIDGKLCDRIHSAYFNYFPDALIMQIPYNGRLARYSNIKMNMLNFELFSLLGWLGTKTWQNLSSEDKNRIQYFVTNKVSKIADEYFDLSSLVIFLCNQYKRHLCTKKYFTQFLEKNSFKHKYFFVEDSSYLGQKASINFLLHKHGFKIIECQHGLVASDHDAYNYSADVLTNLNHPARYYLPDIFLTFGEYWNSIINIPSIKITMGMKYLNDFRETEMILENKPGSILIISSGPISKKTLQIAKTLAVSFKNHTIYYKLHPAEIHLKEFYQELSEFQNITVFDRENPYNLIAKSNIIVGIESTLIMEALAFKGKEFFLKRTTISLIMQDTLLKQ